ncbi:MAG: diacylglycerol kinase family lipid kinase, partial [Candidatus Didemnitutus sp.]|nr:diacylglycerol kinase family lipid kinase [Candidatus Didemnitutus sp.]
DRALADLVSPDRRVIRIDTGTANGHPFVNAMGCGFDAELSWRFNQLQRRGLAAYALTTLKAYFSAPINRYCIRTGKIEKTFDALLVSVANSSQYGNNALIAPAARVDDGQLDLAAVPRLGLGVFAFGARLFSGSSDRSSRTHHMQQAEFTIERAQNGLIHTDGECHETSAIVQVKTVPLSLAVMLAPLAGNRGNSY